eukprot:TRINITY_DN7966_c0_g1_i25.p1 TRINITY_DN7966_c0_g1~~TRINITY_DN7966_c0_g1_i25.p1  ORF type:complete len:211 (-),score=55.83 TRINITY_DN7966_c0_g1_i25:165-797(-)
MNSSKKEALFKLVIIGDASTGKTSLLRRYCDNTFDENYKCTVGVDFQIKVLKMSDQRIVKLQIWDTAGQDRFKVMTKSYYRNAKGCLIIYDLTRKETFENVKTWAEQYSQANPDGKHSMIILGNKKDLEDQRQIEAEEGQGLASELGCNFQEVSAKEGGEEIGEMFLNLAERLLKQEDEKKKGESKTLENRPSITLNRKSVQPSRKENCC